MHSMQSLNKKTLVIVGTLVAGLLFSAISVAEGLENSLSEAKSMCSSISDSNRAMAKAAGYDIDKLCRGLEGMDAKAETQRLEAPEMTPRNTLSSLLRGRDKSSKNESERLKPNREYQGRSESELQFEYDYEPDFEYEDERQSEELKPFGYDLFANIPQSFVASPNIPVSPDYILGPGDELDILFYGKLNKSFNLEINRDGVVDLPELGPLVLAGLSFGEAKEMLRSRVAAQVIGTQVSISMGALRTMQVFVLGEAYRPGPYTVSSLATISHGLISAGGVSDIASLRNIQLKRAGETIATLDLYQLLLSGDMSDDLRLQSGDVIFIPTLENIVSVDGQVLRPAIYELRGDTAVKDLVKLAGGAGPRAYSQSARIERIDGDGFVRVIDLDLTNSADQQFRIVNGDHLTIDEVTDIKKDIVTLEGHVNYPGDFAWRSGMRLSDIVTSIDQFPVDVDLNYALVVRELAGSSDIQVLPLDLKAVLKGGQTDANFSLQSKDKLLFFAAYEDQYQAQDQDWDWDWDWDRDRDRDRNRNRNRDRDRDRDRDMNLDWSRDRDMNLDRNRDWDQDRSRDQNQSRKTILAPILKQLAQQAELGSSARVVSVSGQVRFPGQYPLVASMSLADLITAAGGLSEGAYRTATEVTRTDLADPETATFLTIPVNLSAESAASFQLEPLDNILFKTTPEYRDKETIKLAGEVVFPGEYTFVRGETLSSVIERAGGFSEIAHVEAAAFTRESLKSREEKELARLRVLLEQQAATDQLREANAKDKLSSEQKKMLDQAIADLDAAEAVGRLVIPLQQIISGTEQDIVLEDGDALYVPKTRQEVTVIGEVQQPTSYFYDSKLTLQGYIDRSGGVLKSADRGRVYIVKASGEVVVPKRKISAFFRKRLLVQPGDTIVVPLDTDADRLKGVELLAEVTEIIYQLSLGASAIKALQ